MAQYHKDQQYIPLQILHKISSSLVRVNLK